MKNLQISSRKEKNRIVIFGAVIVLFIIITFLSLCLGVAKLTPAQIINAIREGADSGFTGNIFWHARLPRTAACILAGAGLAVSGVVIQNVLANKLASPSIIGVNAGAGLAVTVCCSLGLISGWAVAGSAFIGAFAAVMMIAITAQKTGASRTTVVLGGVAVNSFLNAISEALRTLLPDVGVISADFRIGGFSAVTATRVLPAGIFILIGLIVVFTLCNELDVLALGEDAAQGLGLSVKKMRTIFFLLAALLAGASVSFAGLLGFVGLIVPHMARRFVGSESRYLLPFCAISGAAFVTLCDLIGRLFFQPYEISVGIIMSFIGGPFFLFLLLSSKGGHRHD